MKELRSGLLYRHKENDLFQKNGLLCVVRERDEKGFIQFVSIQSEKQIVQKGYHNSLLESLVEATAEDLGDNIKIGKMYKHISDDRYYCVPVKVNHSHFTVQVVGVLDYITGNIPLDGFIKGYRICG